MWIVWTLVCFAVLAYLGYAWIAALVSKYEHTGDSLLVFLALGGASVYLGNRVSIQVAPGWTVGPRAAIIACVAFTLFTLFSFIVVNLWCSLLTRKFDDRIASLEEEEEAILRRLDTSRWRALRQVESPAQADRAITITRDEEERAALRKAVEAWEQGGGAARIRSIKVLEWREDLKGKSVDDLREDLRNVEMEARSDPDEARREQARAHAALLSLEILDREILARPAAVRPELPRALPEDEGRARERLQAIQVEIRGQRQAKAEFMRQRIRLAWRGNK